MSSLRMCSDGRSQRRRMTRYGFSLDNFFSRTQALDHLLPMKVLYVLFAIAIPACNATPMDTSDKSNTATAGGRKLLRSNDEDTGSVHEERDGFMPLEEELEELAELVETHHHIREVFTKWCLEHETPESIEKDGSKDEKTVELYKKYMNAHAEKDKEGKKVYKVECKV